MLWSGHSNLPRAPPILTPVLLAFCGSTLFSPCMFMCMLPLLGYPFKSGEQWTTFSSQLGSKSPGSLRCLQEVCIPWTLASLLGAGQEQCTLPLNICLLKSHFELFQKGEPWVISWVLSHGRHSRAILLSLEAPCSFTTVVWTSPSRRLAEVSSLSNLTEEMKIKNETCILGPHTSPGQVPSSLATFGKWLWWFQVLWSSSFWGCHWSCIWLCHYRNSSVKVKTVQPFSAYAAFFRFSYLSVIILFSHE